MVVQPHHIWTEEAYLRFERNSPEKHEYYQGQVYAMAGATRNHIRIVGNVFASLHRQLLARPCEIYMTDMRVKVNDSGLYTYPDIAIVCGQAQFVDHTQDTLMNPTVLIEVLSPSTENYDRGSKFELYQALDSFKEYLLVAQDRARIEHYTRQSDGKWLLHDVKAMDAVLELTSIGCTLALADVYAKITFEADSSSSDNPT